jgi:hypothetical protein
MAFQIVDTNSTPGFGLGPDEVEYRVAEPRWRVRTVAAGESSSSAGWIELIRRLRAENEISLP